MKAIAKARRVWRTRLIFLTLAIVTVGAFDFCTLRYCALNARHIPPTPAQAQQMWTADLPVPGLLLTGR